MLSIFILYIIFVLFGAAQIYLTKYNRKTFYLSLTGNSILLVGISIIMAGKEFLFPGYETGAMGFWFILAFIGSISLNIFNVLLFDLLFTLIYELKHRSSETTNWRGYSKMNIAYIFLSSITLIESIIAIINSPNTFSFIKIIYLIFPVSCLIVSLITHSKIRKQQINFYKLFIIIPALLVFSNLINFLPTHFTKPESIKIPAINNIEREKPLSKNLEESQIEKTNLNKKFIKSDPINYEGEEYPTITIGKQTWFAKNLDFGKFNSTLNMNSQNNSNSKFCYDNLEENCKISGAFYTWYGATKLTANDSNTDNFIQGICPNGWRIPNDQDFVKLEKYLAYDNSDCLESRDNPTDFESCNFAGDELKSIHCTENSLCNITNFNMTLNGYADSNGKFANKGDYGYLWSSTKLSDKQVALSRNFSISSGISRRSFDVNGFFQVRCIKN